MPWRDAIIKVLHERGEGMHYSEIADEIVSQGLRKKVGATPPSTVNSIIAVSIRDEGESSPFLRVSRGVFVMRGATGVADQAPAEQIADDAAEAGLINAFGMFWSRDRVRWSSTPKMLGIQQPGSTPVDFCGQQGVYLLHDGPRTVYVGRTTNRPLGIRLREHTADRLNGRWDRFSWFGVYPVDDSGALKTSAAHGYTTEMLIVTMEALLIEGLEPPLNRKGGDDFRAAEFQQFEDPELKKTQMMRQFEEMINR